MNFSFATRIAAAAAFAVLAGCSAGPLDSATTRSSAPPVTVPAADMLARHDLQGLTTAQVIDRLDASEDDRTNGPVGSVRSGELILSDGEGEATLPMPDDQFYLSIAPYLTKTHECFNHNLASCKGELADTSVHVKIVDASGAVMVDRDVTTFANGFAGLWLPRDIEATLTVTYDGKTATVPVATGDGDPTCLTTLRLE